MDKFASKKRNKILAMPTGQDCFLNHDLYFMTFSTV